MSVQDNIEDEAYAFVKHGTKMNADRDKRWEAFTKEAIKRAIIKVEAEDVLAVEDLERKFASKNGMTYDEWREKANKLYKIDNSVVTSIAFGPSHLKTWSLESHSKARRKVLRLIYYKEYDHFVRTNRITNFRYDPDSNSETMT
jgi:hypothetical protein